MMCSFGLPRVVASSYPGLEFGNAFGVTLAKFASAFGITPGLEFASAFGTTRALEFANAFGVQRSR